MSDARNVTISIFLRTEFKHSFATWAQNMLVELLQRFFTILAWIRTPRVPSRVHYQKTKPNCMVFIGHLVWFFDRGYSIVSGGNSWCPGFKGSEKNSRRWCDQVQFTANQWPCPQRTQWPSLTMEESLHQQTRIIDTITFSRVFFQPYPWRTGASFLYYRIFRCLSLSCCGIFRGSSLNIIGFLGAHLFYITGFF